MDVIEQAIQLGMALAESKEIQALHFAEDALAQDDTAIELLRTLEEQKNAMAQLLMQEDVEREKVEELSSVIDELEKAALENTVIAAVKDSQEGFSSLMEKINAVLKFYITGETETTGGGCAGSCDGCAGCSN
ncbi:YlbF family regulator [Clostridia bacterium OttesenSCG-928-F22]|nr:YlbF family regulator [Clostridia bacterium OttesenSCG-928-F22]